MSAHSGPYLNSIGSHRKRAGISRAELARRVGCSASYVGRVEAGRLALTFDFGDRLARALGLDGPECLQWSGRDTDDSQSPRRAERPAPTPLRPSYSHAPVNARLASSP